MIATSEKELAAVLAVVMMFFGFTANMDAASTGVLVDGIDQ